MSHLTFRLRRSYAVITAWIAHQLIILRMSPAGLALAAVVMVLCMAPLIYKQQGLLALLCVVLYRLLSMLAGWVSKALGHVDVRQGYLRPFMDIILMLSAMAGLVSHSPERLFWPAMTLVVVVLMFDLERRLFMLLQKAHERVTASGNIERIVNATTGGTGRTALLMTACYWPQTFFWSGFAFAGICLLVLIGRLIANYRQLGMRANEIVARVPGDRVIPDVPS